VLLIDRKTSAFFNEYRLSVDVRLHVVMLSVDVKASISIAIFLAKPRARVPGIIDIADYKWLTIHDASIPPCAVITSRSL